MPELIVITFKSESGAEEARNSLNKLPHDQMILIEEAMTVTSQETERVGLDDMRQRAPRLIRIPRSILAAAFTGAFKATAWALVIAGTVGGAVIRGAERIDGKTVEEIEAKLDGAGSALFLMTNGGVPIDLVDSLAEEDVDVLHATISLDNASQLKEHLSPE